MVYYLVLVEGDDLNELVVDVVWGLIDGYMMFM